MAQQPPAVGGDIDSQTLNDWFSYLDTRLDDTATVMDDSIQMWFSKFDYQNMIGKTDLLINDELHVQSVAVDPDHDRFYITRQTTGDYNDQSIYEYQLSTGALLRNKIMPVGVNTKVYLEGIVFFHNVSNELCFVLPIENYHDFGIYNYDTETMESTFTIDGNFKIGFDNNRKYFICCKQDDPNASYNWDITGINIYDFESVKNGTPELVNTMNFTDAYVNPKIQGITMIDDVVIMGRGHGKQILTVIDTAGNHLYSVSHNNSDLVSIMGEVPDPSGDDVVNQGVTWIKENGQTYLVTLTTAQRQAAILKLTDVTKGAKLRRQPFESKNKLAEIANGPVLKIVRDEGEAFLRIQFGQDFMARVAELPGRGLYTFFCSSGAINSPKNAGSLRGLIQVDSGTVGNLDRISVIAQDYRGDLFWNYYDSNRSPAWQGWKKGKYDAVGYET